MGNIPFLTNVDVRGNLTIGTLRGTENEAYAANLLDTNSVIAFGDNSLPTQNVMVGEYGTTDTDQLWLHGKNGTFFSHDGDANEAISIAMQISAIGNVGIGTSGINPADKLHVMGTVRSVVATGSGFGFMTNRGTESSCCGIRWDSNDSSLTLKNSAGTITTHIRSSGFSYFNGGNVGIGNSIPLHKLSIEKAQATLLKIRNTTNGGGAAIEFNDNGSSAATQNGTITYYHSDSASQGGGSSYWLEGEDDQTLVLANNGRVVVQKTGSSTEVGYGFYDDINTGMYRIGADNLGFATGGINRLNITGALATFSENLTVNGGSIILGGVGRIQGVDTVSALTDAANKAYVDAHTSGIGGSGTTNSIPMFTPNGTTIGNSAMSQANIGTGTAKRITVAGARMTITGNGGDGDGGTLNLSSSSARLGIAVNSYPSGITEPEASLDVGKNARVRGSLNVGPTTEQYLFVSTTGDNPVGYVKMGYYGSGVEWGSSTTTNRTPQYSTGFGSGGKVVEDARYYTFKISFASMGTIDTAPRVLIAQDTGPYTYIVEDFYVFQDNTSSGNAAPAFNSDLRLDYKWTPAVGTVRTSTAWVVPQATINAGTTARTRRTLMQGVSAGALSVSGGGLQEGSGTAYARASIILTASSVSYTSSPGNYYLRLKVKKINIINDILNNTETITIT